MDDYKDIKDLLKPRRDIKATGAFRDMIEAEMGVSRAGRRSAKWLWFTLPLGAAAAVLTLLLIPAGLSAQEILTDAISAIRQSCSIEIKADIRTESREIFDRITPTSEFVAHEIIVQRCDSATYWYVNKGERAAEKNADGLYVWIEPYNIGWIYPERNFDVLGYLNILLNPEQILESELQYTLNAPKADYNMTKDKGEITLTIHSMPQGEYANPYVFNTSVPESESVRRYVVDAQTHRLKSASVSMVVDGKEVEVLKVTDINYGPQSISLPAIPDYVNFIKYAADAPSGIPGLDARETASVILNALSNWDTDILHRYFYPRETQEIYRPAYQGAQLLQLGEPFHSGSNPHLIFVPYTLRMPDGTLRHHALALTKSPSTPYHFDGGL